MPTDLSLRAALPRVIERRNMSIGGSRLELRAKDAGTLNLTGYACVTESGYEMQDWLGEFTEIVRHGAFATTLGSGCDVPLKVNHEGITLARTKSGTMNLLEDTTGLLVDASLDARSPAVLTLQSAMDRGDVDEMSFAFWVTRQEWSPDWTQRDILEVNLNKGDVSMVNYGANPATSGHLRGLESLERLSDDEAREALARLEARFAPAAAPAITGATLSEVLNSIRN